MVLATIEDQYNAHNAALRQMIGESAALLVEVAECIVACFQIRNKLLICGNGGSAADAQHVAAEFVNRFRLDRAALPAIALVADSAILTCVSNDSAFDNIFSRQIEALAISGDIVAGLSTSGRSANVLKALNAARARGAVTIGFTGALGAEPMRSLCDYCLVVPSIDTARIQECHEFAWHVICDLVEASLFPSNPTFG
jgi:D-sedoheptulose 7-phosphate isomerase